jgi:hypothetical protein
VEVNDVGFVHVPVVDGGLATEQVVDDGQEGTPVVGVRAAVGLLEVPALDVFRHSQLGDQFLVGHLLSMIMIEL